MGAAVAGRLIGHLPEGEQGATDRVDVRHVRREPGGPLLVLGHRRLDLAMRDVEVAGLGVRREPGGLEHQLVALGHVELVVVGVVAGHRQPGATQHQLGRARRWR